MDEKLSQLVHDWVLKAEHDLGAAKTLIEYAPDYLVYLFRVKLLSEYPRAEKIRG